MDFVWHKDRALHPKWRPLDQPLLGVLSRLMADADTTSE
jgi:hypothetical protein